MHTNHKIFKNVGEGISEAMLTNGRETVEGDDKERC